MQTPQKIELLSPAKNANTAIEAIKHGADAVYIGAPKFGARAAAGNSLDDIRRTVDFAHSFNARIYATVNTILYDNELKEAEQMIRMLYNVGVDALIVQDMGILRLDIPPIALHASTQCDTRTVEKAKFLESVGFSQIVLARELTLSEIREICQNVSVPVECFVHGALCVSYSGKCHASCAFKDRSANRGECAQICRLSYDLTDTSGDVLLRNRHLLSLRDLNLSDRLEDLLNAGVSSFKIEGRLKELSYVKNVTAFYHQRFQEICRAHPDRFYRASAGEVALKFKPCLSKSFNRQFTHYFLDNRNPSTSPMASLNTPKSIGEPIGKITHVQPGCLQVSGNTHISNGDGLVFFNRTGELQGFRANKVEGNQIYPFEKIPAYKGAMLYRNADKTFTDILNKESATRLLPIDIQMTQTPSGYVAITVSDCLGNVVTILSDFIPEQAKSDQSRAQKQIFSKLGNTPYRLSTFDAKGTETLFIPASTLTSLRRSIIDALTRTSRMRYRFSYRITENRNIPYVLKTLSFAENVANKLAREFYNEHQAATIEPAMETQQITKKNPVLMTTRYCIRRELNCCLKSGNAGRLPDQLQLKSSNIRMSVEFDCKNCQMILRKLWP